MKIKSEFKNIKEIFYDFDGVFTNNKFYLSSKGEEFYYFDKSDSLAITYLKLMGFKQHILTSEKSNIVKLRSKKMGIGLISTNNKFLKLKNYLKNKKNISLNEIAFIGNDLNDLEIIKNIKFSFCPKDSDPNIIKYSKIILKKNGGEGVIKEFFRKIISL